MTYKDDFMLRVMKALLTNPDMSFEEIADHACIPIDKIEDCVEDPAFIKDFHDFCVARNMAPHMSAVTKKITEKAKGGDVAAIKLYRESLGLASSEVKLDLSLASASDDELRNRIENMKQKLAFEDAATIIPDNAKASKKEENETEPKGKEAEGEKTN